MSPPWPQDAAELDAWLRAHGFMLRGQTIPTALRPVVLTTAQAHRLGVAAELLLRVLARFSEAYLSDARLRDELRLPSHEEALVRINPGYSGAVQIGRLDAVVSGSRIAFVEANADSPASMAFTDVAYQLLRHAWPDGLHADRRPVRHTPLVPSVVAALMAVHREAHNSCRNPPAPPRVAVVDVAGTATACDIVAVTRALRAHGADTVEATPAALTFDGDRLFVGDLPVDLVYRRVLVDELDECDITAAARAQRVAVVNGFRSRVANNKKTLALLDDPRFRYLIRKDEARVVRATVPWTRILRSGTAKRREGAVELPEFALANRENLVIKPAASYAGRGVHIGTETAQADWETAVLAACENHDHVVQDYVPPPRAQFPVLERGAIETKLLHVNISPFVIRGRHAGIMARASPRSLVNLTGGGALLPCVVVLS